MTQTTTETLSDPAAELGAALSLVEAATKLENLLFNTSEFNISEMFNGYDEFMRQAMTVARRFEAWACDHVDFTYLSVVWPYFLEERFGEAFLLEVKLNMDAKHGDYNNIADVPEEVFSKVARRLKVKVTNG